MFALLTRETNLYRIHCTNAKHTHFYVFHTTICQAVCVCVATCTHTEVCLVEAHNYIYTRLLFLLTNEGLFAFCVSVFFVFLNLGAIIAFGNYSVSCVVCLCVHHSAL